MNAVQKVRDEVAATDTKTLIALVEQIEDANPTSDEEGVRVLYAVACAELCRRLNLDPQTVASSVIGPAAAFTVAAL